MIELAIFVTLLRLYTFGQRALRAMWMVPSHGVALLAVLGHQVHQRRS